MLEINHLKAAYGQHPALQDVSLKVDKGEIVVILGANGAGKSTLLRAIGGVCDGDVSGNISLSGKSLLGLSADEIVASGIALVPEGRGIFADLTVKENLLLGAYTARARTAEAENLERVLSLFPKLGERQSQIARTMSGGEQQMVAIGRAMMSAPDILMLDEPSLGLSPLLCKELFQNLARVRELQIGILLVEQNARQSLAIADRGYLLENTRITHEDTAANLATDPAVQKAYLGAGASAIAATTSTAIKESIQRTETSTDAPSASAFTTSKGEARRSAEQQIGSSIEELVSKATQTSAGSSVDHTLPASFNGPGSGLGNGPSNNDPSSAGVNQNSSTKVTPRANGAAISPPVSGVSSTDVDRVILDIENAAKAARERASARTNSRSAPGRKVASGKKSEADSDKQSNPINRDESDSKPPVIEVYKRPRVEVYRRRPSGDFERD